MNQYSNDLLLNHKAKSIRSKYNKLTKEQKIQIIKEWDSTRLSALSIAEKFSSQWNVHLSCRGVADIIAFWRKNGKLRGYSDENKLYLSLRDELSGLFEYCLQNELFLSKQQFLSVVNSMMYLIMTIISSYSTA